MILETTVNLKNKNKDELIMFIKEAQKVIETQQKELGKKDKIIKEIAKALVNHVGTCPTDYSGNLEEKCEKCNDTYEKCWIEYFEKKVEGEKDGRKYILITKEYRKTKE